MIYTIRDIQNRKAFKVSLVFIHQNIVYEHWEVWYKLCQVIKSPDCQYKLSLIYIIVIENLAIDLKVLIFCK